jgi:nucleoid DNA-binding protein
MRSSRTRAIIRKIAEEENLSIKQIDDIVYSFFRFTSKRMKEGDKATYTFKDTRLFKFGTFKVKPGRKNQLRRRDEKLNDYSKRSSDNLSGSSDDQRVQENLD